ncbi:hypothetical protein H9Q10_08605 [Eikenella sp. S3360]|uniref:Uncharacterized protein n=1 Tax=Eikenella glucosivorans TaxID=2766967 RepID=A0ABS0NBU1_9NEIS|nr:hypothetical protein [Eikenella glucosivorans]MBH5329727.1 hypothetical protein [Eikenella glucosivorans]
MGFPCWDWMGKGYLKNTGRFGQPAETSGILKHKARFGNCWPREVCPSGLRRTRYFRPTILSVRQLD